MWPARSPSRGARRLPGPFGRRERTLPRFDLAEFLAKTGIGLTRLASHLRVAPSYLEAALEGATSLATRDQQACRLLWRRLFRAKQLELPFAEPPETFSRTHARTRARAAALRSTAVAAAEPSGRRARHEAGTAQP